MRKSIGIEGIDYVLRTPSFGEDLRSLEEAASIEFDGTNPSMKLHAGAAAISSLKRALESWTFRGVDEKTEVLIKGGEILPITLDNIQKLPSSHGHTLSRLSKKMTDFTDFTEKNL